MSERGPDFLARWSQRKRAVEDAERPPAEAPDRAAPRDQTIDPAAHEGLPEEEIRALPSIEDLTAESDVSAFLRNGVPQPLRTAALRKMWSLDPAIRDFVGLSENAWDFNDPASIPGFGAIAESAGALLAQAVLGPSPLPVAAAATTDASLGAPVDSGAPEKPIASAEETHAALEDAPASAARETADEDVALPVHERPRHGGAIPK